MSHHYVVDCGEKGVEKWEAGRQSCLLMACKVISCGLVKLKAASLGCNSWQSCPPFTLANPSFRAFSDNHRFMERGRKRRLYEARKKLMTSKNFAIRHRMKRNLNGNPNAIRREALDDARKHYERDLGKLQNGSLVSFCPAVKHFCMIIQVINMAEGLLLFILMWSLPALCAENDMQNFLFDTHSASASPFQKTNVHSRRAKILISLFILTVRLLLSLFLSFCTSNVISFWLLSYHISNL